MKIANVIVMVIILLLTTAVAYAAPIDNVTSSAFMPGDSAIFNLDFVDPFGLNFFNVMINARNSGSTQNINIPLAHSDLDPYYLTTYFGNAIFNNPASTIEYYGRVEADTFVITQSYKNTANQFPPDSILYARLANDAIGDTAQGSAGPFLDLTGAGITYSDTKIFAKLNNVSGGWPRSQGFTTYYIYGFFLGDLDTITTSITAMVYSNVPVILPAGLYIVNLADTSFQRLGNIQSQTSGNTLNMSCNISDLLTDPTWPVWPPQRGFILGLGFTFTFDIIGGGVTFNDYSYPSAFIPATQYLRTGQNSAPILSDFNYQIVPNIGLNFFCNYSDADNNLPVIRQLLFDSGIFDMGAFDHSYSDTAQFTYNIIIPSDGMHYYYFRFSDGESTFETPMDSLLINPSGLEDSPLPIVTSLHQNYPNPFNAETQISFDLSTSSNINLSIYDASGRYVTTLIDSRLNAGSHNVIWNGKDKTGQTASSGIYFYRLSIDGITSDTKRMILLK